jgi:hypothetical protein
MERGENIQIEEQRNQNGNLANAKAIYNEVRLPVTLKSDQLDKGITTRYVSMFCLINYIATILSFFGGANFMVIFKNGKTLVLS